MYKLETSLRSFLQKEMKIPSVYLSTSKEPGEGEHKIIHHIKENARKEDSVVIYGLDADLLFLSMPLENRLFLLREGAEVNRSIREKFIFVQMDVLRKEVMVKMRSDKDRSIKDFVCLCFLLGNDFMPKLFTIDIYANGIPFLINQYNSIKKKMGDQYLVDVESNELNQRFLVLLMRSISIHEQAFIRQQHEKFRARAIPQNKRFDDNYQRCVYVYENLLDHKDKWGLDGVSMKRTKNKFYGRVFSKTGYTSHDTNDLCQQYIKTMNWCSKYYFEACPDWGFYYQYHYSPLPTDITLFLAKNPGQRPQFSVGEPLHPLEQLLIIIPPSNKNIVYKPFRGVYDIPCYKTKPKTYSDYVTKRYQAKLVLGKICTDTIKKEVCDIRKTIDTKKPYLEYLFGTVRKESSPDGRTVFIQA